MGRAERLKNRIRRAVEQEIGILTASQEEEGEEDFMFGGLRRLQFTEKQIQRQSKPQKPDYPWKAYGGKITFKGYGSIADYYKKRNR